MKMPKSKYEQTKVSDEPLIKEMLSVQDFSILSIDDSGIFELPARRFSKIINFSKVLKTISCRFSYSVANEHVILPYSPFLLYNIVCECLMSSAFNSILSIILCFIGIHALL